MFKVLLERIASELNQAKIPYMIIGGQAVLLYGEPRLTKDIDITLGIGIEKLPDIKKLAQNIKLKSLVEKVEDFVRNTMVFPTQDPTSGIRVDFIFSFSPYERQAIDRSVPIVFSHITIQFASLEDVIIHKIFAKRPRDLEDVRSILIKNPEYDIQYINKWLEKFDESLGENFLETFRKIASTLKSE